MRVKHINEGYLPVKHSRLVEANKQGGNKTRRGAASRANNLWAASQARQNGSQQAAKNSMSSQQNNQNTGIYKDPIKDPKLSKKQNRKSPIKNLETDATANFEKYYKNMRWGNAAKETKKIFAQRFGKVGYYDPNNEDSFLNYISSFGALGRNHFWDTKTYCKFIHDIWGVQNINLKNGFGQFCVYASKGFIQRLENTKSPANIFDPIFSFFQDKTGDESKYFRYSELFTNSKIFDNLLKLSAQDVLETLNLDFIWFNKIVIDPDGSHNQHNYNRLATLIHPEGIVGRERVMNYYRNHPEKEEAANAVIREMVEKGERALVYEGTPQTDSEHNVKTTRTFASDAAVKWRDKSVRPETIETIYYPQQRKTKNDNKVANGQGSNNNNLSQNRQTTINNMANNLAQNMATNQNLVNAWNNLQSSGGNAAALQKAFTTAFANSLATSLSNSTSSKS